MADTVGSSPSGSIDSHPDFPEFFRQAREEVFGEFSPRVEQALTSGNSAAFERLSAEIDRQARQRAVVATRAMLNFASGRGGSVFSRQFRGADAPTLSGAESQPEAPAPTAAPEPSAAEMLRMATGFDLSAPISMPAAVDPPPLRPGPGGPPQTLTGAPVVTSAPSPTAWMRDAVAPTPTPLNPQTAMESYGQPGYRPTSRAAIGPQSLWESEDLAAENNQPLIGALGEVSGVAPLRRAGLAASEGRPLEAAGNIGLAMFPYRWRAGLGLLGGSVALDALGDRSATAQTPGAPTVGSQQARVDALNASHAKLTAEQTALSERETAITGLSRASSRDAIKAAQRLLGMTDDGVFGPGTEAKVKAELARIPRRRAEITGELARLQTQIDRQDSTLSGLRSDAYSAEAEANIPWWRRAIRDYAPMAAGAAGVTAAGVVRRGFRLPWIGEWGGLRGRAETAAQRVADDANALVTPGSDLSGRVSGTTEFFRRGGGRPPFQVDAHAPLGFTADVPAQQGVGNLYRPGVLGGSTVRSGDLAQLGVYSGVAGYAEFRRQLAEDRVAQAREAFDRQRSQANADELARAQLELEVAKAARGYGLGGMLGAAAAPFRYPIRGGVRPDLRRAEQEVMDINAVLRQGPLRPLSERRTTPGPAGGHWVAPGAPATAGEIWASPSGRDLIMRGDDGRFRLYQRVPMGADAPAGRGKIVPDPRQDRIGRGWLRMSLAGSDDTGVG